MNIKLVAIDLAERSFQELLSNLVYGLKSSGDPVRLFDFLSVDELHALDNLGQVSEAT